MSGVFSEKAKTQMAIPYNDTPCPHQWQPIETAPKDGTEVFVAYVDGYRAIGFFVGERWRERYTETICYPTHWMPLPPLPEVTE